MAPPTCKQNPAATAVWTQASPSPDHQQCFDSASDLGVCCRCVSATADWLQGVGRLFAACWDQVWLVRNDLGTVMDAPTTIPRGPGGADPARIEHRAGSRWW